MLKKIITFSFLFLAFNLSHAFTSGEYAEGEYLVTLSVDFEMASLTKNQPQEAVEAAYKGVTSDIFISSLSNDMLNIMIDEDNWTDTSVQTYKMKTNPPFVFVSVYKRASIPSLRMVTISQITSNLIKTDVYLTAHNSKNIKAILLDPVIQNVLKKAYITVDKEQIDNLILIQ